MRPKNYPITTESSDTDETKKHPTTTESYDSYETEKLSNNN